MTPAEHRDTVVIGSTLWRDGKTLQLGLTHAIAVNERDQVMGYVALEYRKPGDPQSSECYRAALWQNGRIVNLGALGGPGPCTAQRPRAFSDTTAINERGLIVGVSSSHGREHGERAVLWMPAG